MSVVELLTLVGVLAAIVSSAVEWLKNILATTHFDDNWSEEAHAALIQAFALIVGAFVGYMAQLDVVHTLLPSSGLPLVACYLLSGAALALPADALKTLLQWTKAARDAKERVADAAQTTSTSVKIDAQSETVSTPPPRPTWQTPAEGVTNIHG